MKKVDINDAQYPARKKAIEIMEFLADKLGNPKMFDCHDNTLWYDIEDELTNIIARKEHCKKTFNEKDMEIVKRHVKGLKKVIEKLEKEK